MVQVYPNSRNVVPGEVTFSIDMRNLSDAAVDEMDRQLRAFIARVQQESGLAVALRRSATIRRRRSIRIASRPLPMRRRDLAIRRGRSSPAPGMMRCI
jgi:acetylornithine deacetylase/succinyl-diaminopimelate desuccinylase-like protein